MREGDALLGGVGADGYHVFSQWSDDIDETQLTKLCGLVSRQLIVRFIDCVACVKTKRDWRNCTFCFHDLRKTPKTCLIVVR